MEEKYRAMTLPVACWIMEWLCSITRDERSRSLAFTRERISGILVSMASPFTVPTDKQKRLYAEA
jgi:hypothetical protein